MTEIKPIEVSFGVGRDSLQMNALAIKDNFPDWEMIGYDTASQQLTLQASEASFRQAGYDGSPYSIEKAIRNAVQEKGGGNVYRERLANGETVPVPQTPARTTLNKIKLEQDFTNGS